MSNPWFRMYAEFATDPKVQMLSEVQQRRFVMVLCLRCSNEHVTLQDEEVAFQLRISNEEWAATKAVFRAKELINEDNTPTAWEKRQFRSDSSAERVAKHRAKKKQDCNVTATPPDSDSETDSKGKQPLSESSNVGGATPPATPTPRRQRGNSSQGTRLPAEWVLPKKWGDEALEIRPDLTADDVRREADNFRDHWLAKSGRDACKVDWQATWRKWIRNDLVKPGAGKSGAPGKPEFVAPWYAHPTGIRNKAKEIGISQQAGEDFPPFSRRVLEHQGVTEAMLMQAAADIRRHKIDTGQRV